MYVYISSCQRQVPPPCLGWVVQCPASSGPAPMSQQSCTNEPAELHQSACKAAPMSQQSCTNEPVELQETWQISMTQIETNALLKE